MSAIGSHPGAILFRLSIMIILIAIMTTVFFSYIDATQRELERTSIIQTKKIIDSSLAVVFATYAVKGKLNELNDIDGGNPFIFLREYQILPPAYRGEIDHDVSKDLIPGWYYLRHHKRLVYVSRYLEVDYYYTIILNYEDVNQSDRFESTIDKFQNLQLVKTGELSKGVDL